MLIGESIQCNPSGTMAVSRNALLLLARLMAASAFSIEIMDEAPKRNRTAAAILQSMPKCRMTGVDTCSMRDMPRGKPILVYPGGNASCIDNMEYAFQVWPGRTDKLLFYWQGGGVCWNWATYAATVQEEQLCITSLRPSANVGVFDQANPRNPFRDYTIVQVLYCSGDLYLARKDTGTYFHGTQVRQQGYSNTQSALDWAVDQLDLRLQSLVVMGCSAGSVGAQVWARKVLNTFPAERASVVADSFAGVLPAPAQHSLMHRLSDCDETIMPADLCSVWHEVTVSQVFDRTIKDFPGVTFASVNSKSDKIQVMFWTIVTAAFPTSGEPLTINNETFLGKLNRNILQRYDRHTNFVSYLVDGSVHCFTCHNWLYSADTTGPAPKNRVSKQLPLAAWLLGLVDGGTSRFSGSECSGELLKWPAWHGTTYCDKAQYGKKLATLGVASTVAAEGNLLGGFRLPDRIDGTQLWRVGFCIAMVSLALWFGAELGIGHSLAEAARTLAEQKSRNLQRDYTRHSENGVLNRHFAPLRSKLLDMLVGSRWQSSQSQDSEDSSMDDL